MSEKHLLLFNKTNCNFVSLLSMIELRYSYKMFGIKTVFWFYKAILLAVRKYIWVYWYYLFGLISVINLEHAQLPHGQMTELSIMYSDVIQRHLCLIIHESLIECRETWVNHIRMSLLCNLQTDYLWNAVSYLFHSRALHIIVFEIWYKYIFILLTILSFFVTGCHKVNVPSLLFVSKRCTHFNAHFIPHILYVHRVDLISINFNKLYLGCNRA